MTSIFYRTTALIPFNASDAVVQSALLNATYSVCSPHVLPSPLGSGVLTVNDYEADGSFGASSGSLVEVWFRNEIFLMNCQLKVKE